jgi:hypothetical protein
MSNSRSLVRLRAHRLTSAGKDRPQARRLNAAGFSFAVVGRGQLLMLLLPFKAMLLSERARGRKSGSPPLFAPFFKVQRNTAHNQSSGFAVAPRVKGLNARGPLKVHLFWQRLEDSALARPAVAVTARHLTARKPRTHQRPFLESWRGIGLRSSVSSPASRDGRLEIRKDPL